MNKEQQLKELILTYWGISDASMDWNTEFNSQHLSNFSSLRMLRFLAGVEDRFKVTIEDVDNIRRFQDLLGLVGN